MSVGTPVINKALIVGWIDTLRSPGNKEQKNGVAANALVLRNHCRKQALHAHGLRVLEFRDDLSVNEMRRAIVAAL